MRKKFALAAAALAAAIPLVACNDAPSGETPVDTDIRSRLENMSVTLTASASGTRLSWPELDGVSFDVYRADTRFGTYRPVERDITNGAYSDGTRYSYYRVVGKGDGIKRTIENISEEIELFGKNTYVISPDDDVNLVRSAIADIYSHMSTDEFSSNRYGILLKPGMYDDRLNFNVGYYTTVAGLGVKPSDTSIKTLSSKNNPEVGNALINFWRGAENLAVRSDTTWAVSQGAFLRAADIAGDLVLHDNGGYASGGFLGDCSVSGTAASGSQQQWLSRNCSWNKWEGNVWNMCFAGVDAPPEGNYPELKYTVEQTTTVREKPYITFDETNGYRIAVPAVRSDATGCDRSERACTYIAADDIYFARADRDTADTISAAIASGKAIALAPGVYSLDSDIRIERDGAVILGFGLATLTPTAGNACLTVGSCRDVSVSGLLFDAGAVKSDCLASIGTADSDTTDVRLFDCFFRVGRSTDEVTAAECCLRVYASDSICDDLWLWRADHGGSANRSEGVGWTQNIGETGMEVYGDNVTAYCLMAEHFKKHNVVWKGNGGKVFFYQSEIAYDVPEQTAWMDGERNGYASIRVDDAVDTFTAKGLGIYTNFTVADITLDHAMLVPDKPGVNVEHICTVQLSAKGRTDNIINSCGIGAHSHMGMSFVTSYSNGVTT